MKDDTLPFPAGWEATLNTIHYYTLLHPEDQAELQRKIELFIKEKRFEGCAGFVINDEVKVVIAAFASILALCFKDRPYPNVKTILVYPTTFIAEKDYAPGVIANPRRRLLLGQAWRHDFVILAWDSIESSLSGDADGNVIVHEFAHQLDVQDGYFDGVPPLPGYLRHRIWQKILEREFEWYKRGSNESDEEFGVEDAAEFFAEASEKFFCCPKLLRAKRRDLYELLMLFYRQDPARCEGGVPREPFIRQTPSPIVITRVNEGNTFIDPIKAIEAELRKHLFIWAALLGGVALASFWPPFFALFWSGVIFTALACFLLSALFSLWAWLLTRRAAVIQRKLKKLKLEVVRAPFDGFLPKDFSRSFVAPLPSFGFKPLTQYRPEKALRRFWNLLYQTVFISEDRTVVASYPCRGFSLLASDRRPELFLETFFKDGSEITTTTSPGTKSPRPDGLMLQSLPEVKGFKELLDRHREGVDRRVNEGAVVIEIRGTAHFLAIERRQTKKLLMADKARERVATAEG